MSFNNQTGRLNRKTVSKPKEETSTKKVVINSIIKNEDPTQSIYYNCSETGSDVKYVGSNHAPRRICDWCRKVDFPPIVVNGFEIDHLGCIVKLKKEGNTLDVWVDGMACSIGCGIAMDEIEYSCNNAISAGSKYPDPYSTFCSYIGCDKPKKSPSPRLAEWNGGPLPEKEYHGDVTYRPSHIKMISISDCRTYFVAVV